jgi:hypothetical protein
MRNAILLSLLMAVSMPVLAVYKCESQGHVTYTDIPCGTGHTALPALPLPADAAGARQRAANEKRRLAAIEKGQEADRLGSEREQRRRKQDKTAIALQKKCALLGLERKWSAEDAAAESHSVSEKTQKLKKAAQRKAERHEAECMVGS